MLNYYLNYFSSEKDWMSNRHKTFFSSLKDVEKYQKNKILFLNKFYKTNVKASNIITKVPESINCEKLQLYRSGLTSVTSDRAYFYSKTEQTFVEQHHIWKIEQSHNLSQKGNVVWITPRQVNYKNKDRLFGPNKYLSTGFQNDTYEVYYDQTWDKEMWEHNLKLIKKLKPKFIRTSPSTIETIYYFLCDEIIFDCPVMLSEETLQNEIRLMAERIFSKVIDKMVCWDGCMGWFECPHGTKHIYDEFCHLERINGILVTTDLNNFASPFIRYANGDEGEVDQIECKCGLVGNYFKNFYGKIIESIFIEDEKMGKIVPGRYLSEKLSVFLRLGKEYSFQKKHIIFDKKLVYRIKQNNDLSIDFQYSAEKEFTDLQERELINFLKRTLWQNKNCKKIFISKKNIDEVIVKTGRRSKSLFIESDYVKNLRKPIVGN